MLGVCLAALLAVTTARADPRSPADARVALERQRSRYAEALDRASWRREDPSLNAVADEVTVEALAVLDDAPGLDGEVRTLVREAAGAALGPWLRQRGVTGDSLLGAWLRAHDDPSLLAALGPRDPFSRLALAQEVVLDRPDLAAELIEEGLRNANPRMGDFCAVAAAIPAPRRRALATITAQAPHGELFADCLALIASEPALRLALARRTLAELARTPTQLAGIFSSLSAPFDDRVWPVVAAALVLPDVPAPVARRLLDGLERQGADLSWIGSLAMLPRVAPMIHTEHPAVARLFALLDRRTRGAVWRALPVPDRARAASLAASPALPHDVTDDVVRDVALSAPRDPSRALAALRAIAVTASGGGFEGRVTVRLLLSWIEALERAARCGDDACLRGLLRDATDEAASRAAWLLGAQGLATLPHDDARALVRRLVMDVPIFEPGPLVGRFVEPSSLARVVFGTLRACPASLSGLSSVEVFGITTYDDPIAAWRVTFALRCRDARPARNP